MLTFGPIQIIQDNLRISSITSLKSPLSFKVIDTKDLDVNVFGGHIQPTTAVVYPYGLSCIPPKDILKSNSPVPYNVALFGYRVFGDVNKLK